jgi:hypothetical protein
MMKGFSLLEFLIAVSFFFLILLSGYNALDSQSHLFKEMLARTRTEEESNYRLLVLQTILQRSSEKFKADPMLGRAVYFFEDLNFGTEPKSDAFSFAIPIGAPIRFQWDGSLINVSASSNISGKKMVLLAGLGSTEEFEWNYARVLQITKTAELQQLKLQFLLKKNPIQLGSLTEVDINGIVFRNGELFWVSPSGQYEPFFEPVEEFHYEWNSPRLKIFWRTGRNEASLTLTP